MKNSLLHHWSKEKKNDNGDNEKEGKHKPSTQSTRSDVTYNSHIERRGLCYRDWLEDGYTSMCGLVKLKYKSSAEP